MMHWLRLGLIQLRVWLACGGGGDGGMGGVAVLVGGFAETERTN